MLFSSSLDEEDDEVMYSVENVPVLPYLSNACCSCVLLEHLSRFVWMQPLVPASINDVLLLIFYACCSVVLQRSGEAGSTCNNVYCKQGAREQVPCVLVAGHCGRLQKQMIHRWRRNKGRIPFLDTGIFQVTVRETDIKY